MLDIFTFCVLGDLGSFLNTVNDMLVNTLCSALLFLCVSWSARYKTQEISCYAELVSVNSLKFFFLFLSCYESDSWNSTQVSNVVHVSSTIISDLEWNNSSVLLSLESFECCACINVSMTLRSPLLQSNGFILHFHII